MLRPVALEDTLATLIRTGGVDTALAMRERARARYAGRMAWDLSDIPLRALGEQLQVANFALATRSG